MELVQDAIVNLIDGVCLGAFIFSYLYLAIVIVTFLPTHVYNILKGKKNINWLIKESFVLVIVLTISSRILDPQINIWEKIYSIFIVSGDLLASVPILLSVNAIFILFMHLCFNSENQKEIDKLSNNIEKNINNLLLIVEEKTRKIFNNNQTILMIFLHKK